MEINYNITGMVESSNGPVIFIYDGVRFLFLTDKIEDIFDNEYTMLTADINGYLHGYTHQGRLIYIYAGRDLKVHSKLFFHTNLYFLSLGNLDKYDFKDFRGIRIENGTLRKIFQPNATIMERTDDGLNVKTIDDHLEYKVMVCGKQAILKVNSSTLEKHSIEEGHRISNESVKLDLIFDMNHPISDMTTVYMSIIALCRLMTGRKNVGFDDVSLLVDREDFAGKPYPAFSCFFESISESLTNRPPYECIQFSELGSGIERIMQIFSSKSNKFSCTRMDFLTSDESRPYKVTDTRIKEVISSFESASNLVKLDLVPDQKVVELKELLSKTVKEQKYDSESFTNNILTYLGKWKITTADLILSAYAKYEFALNIIEIPKEYRLCNEGVYALIKHRNDTTHGRISEINSQKIFSTFQIIALTYCCILDAARIPHETIKKIMQKHIFNPY